MLKVKKNIHPSIKKLCNNLSIFSMLLSLIFSFIISLIVFLDKAENTRKMEIQRIYDISPLILRPLEAYFIIGDNRSIKALLIALRKKFHIDNLYISNQLNNCQIESFLFYFISKKTNICIQMQIPNRTPISYLVIKTKYNQTNLLALIKILISINIIVMILGFLYSLIIRKRLYKFVASPIKMLSENPDRLDLRSNYVASEILELQRKLKSFLIKVENQRNLLETNKLQEKIYQITLQVAHDIRSPLSTINTILSLNSISFNEKMVIKTATKRINDIANNLLEKSKLNKKKLQEEQIYTVLENIVLEKSYEYIERNVDMKLSISSEAYNCFTKLDICSFKQVLSNIINNSFDAIENKGEVEGKIQVFLKCTNLDICIQIEDNGCGIPNNLIPMAKEGISFNKRNGRGLGLSFAEKYVNEVGGKLTIDSIVNIGTKINIFLKKCPPPFWFFKSLQIFPNSEIIILDTTFNKFDIWKTKFSSFSGLKISYYNINELINIKEKFSKHAIYLIAHINNFRLKGLDIVSSIKSTLQKYLIVDNIEDNKLLDYCKNNEIKIINRSYIPFLSIELISDRNKIIFIDDDSLMRETWKIAAEEKNINLFTYASFKDFLKDINNFSKEIKIYIDYNLNDKITGQDHAKYLYDQGFLEIYLCTGYNKNDIPLYTWVKDIIGKDPPFM